MKSKWENHVPCLEQNNSYLRPQWHCVTDCTQTWWLKTKTLYYFSSMVLLNWAPWGSLMLLWLTVGQLGNFANFGWAFLRVWSCDQENSGELSASCVLPSPSRLPWARSPGGGRVPTASMEAQTQSWHITVPVPWQWPKHVTRQAQMQRVRI